MIWIDLTEVINWTGHPSGIQRVIFSIAESLKNEVGFVDYKRGRGFRKCDLPVRAIGPVDTSHAPTNLRQPQKDIKATAQYTVAWFFWRLPEPVKVVVRQIVDLKSRFLRMLMKDEISIFGQNDTLIIPGCFWAYRTFIADLDRYSSGCQLKIVPIVYDLIPWTHPHYVAPKPGEWFSPRIASMLSKADRILTISQSSKRDLEHFRDAHGITSAAPIDVIRLGDFLPDAADDRPMNLSIHKPFVLTVSTVEIRKNHYLLYMAWKHMIATQAPREIPTLVIVGRAGYWTKDLQNLIENDPETKPYIKWLKKVSDVELNRLYRDCSFTVYPSLAEGWGLPVAESLNHGKLCLTTRSSSIPEVGGECVEYMDAYDVVGWAAKILELMERSKIDGAFSEQVQKYKPVTWQQTADQIIEILNSSVVAKKMEMPRFSGGFELSNET